ncbi:MAG TPA: beta-1,3-glucanase family protein [Cytophagales bacterium]|nr:beta-1,3-glucanase family protein [Cytophagales bacterium]
MITLIYSQIFKTLKKSKGLAFIVLMLMSTVAMSQPVVPFTIVNRSNPAIADANIFVALVGEQPAGYHVWMDLKTGQIKPMNVSDNTVPGPTPNGNMGPGGNGRYANCFTRLSEIPNKVINVPGIAGTRILISFNQQLYLYFFGANGSPKGYAAPDLNNPNDPNQGIRFENIELTNAPNGLWVNTTRVDTYQYPMGLEVWGGNNFYQKAGELKTHAQILSQWQSQAPAPFNALYDAAKGIIHFPSKTPAFREGGSQANYFGGYIDQIWSKYSSGDLVFNSGDAGVWRGRVNGGQMRFVRDGDGAVGLIPWKPTTQDALEAKGALATGGQWDKVVQAQVAAAINRHALDLNLPVGAMQNFGSPSNYYNTFPYNWYAKFWHQSDISYNSKTYAFSYDDVFDQSATINAGSPIRATVTIGGFAGIINPTGVATAYQDCNYGGASAGLPVGDYNLSAMISRGINNDWISSIRVNSGYKVTLYEHDNYTGATLVLTGDNSCLVGAGWNDRASSMRVAQNSISFSSTIEAENWIAMSGVQTEGCSEGGLNVGWIEAGDWMAYNVNIPATGTYKVSYRVATPNSGTSLRLEKDAGATNLGTVSIPNTGGWQNWTSVSHNVSLPAGQYAIGIATSTGGFNINRLNVSNNLSARIAPAEITIEPVSEVALYPNPVKGKLNLINNFEENSLIQVMDLSGNQVLKLNLNKGAQEINLDRLAPGAYLIKITNKGTTKVQKIYKE